MWTERRHGHQWVDEGKREVFVFESQSGVWNPQLSCFTTWMWRPIEQIFSLDKHIQCWTHLSLSECYILHNTVLFFSTPLEHLKRFMQHATFTQPLLFIFGMIKPPTLQLADDPAWCSTVWATARLAGQKENNIFPLFCCRNIHSTSEWSLLSCSSSNYSTTLTLTQQVLFLWRIMSVKFQHMTALQQTALAAAAMQ